MFRLLTILFISFFAIISHAEMKRPLPADSAFNLTAHTDDSNQLILEWHIAPNYYLYQNKVKLVIQSGSQMKIGAVELPQGETKQDDIHGKFQIYTNDLKFAVPFTTPAGYLDVQINYQGCSSEGFCYPPVKKYLIVDLSRFKGSQDVTSYLKNKNESQPKAIAVNEANQPSSILSGDTYKQKLMEKGNRLWVILGFFGLGLLLAFTPCVLPMVPILSSIIVGHHKKESSAKPFFLSLAYVLGMAMTYAAVGILIALLGSSFQAAMQKEWVIILFSILLAALAFWLLDFYKMHLPAHWQRRIAGWSHEQKTGTYFGVFVMGALSTLIVSPCVSAPLVGVLAYIAQTGDAVLGGVALLVMGFGMGVPLLLIGMSARKLIPKSGGWMNRVQQFVAILMLAMAIWMLSRVLSSAVILFLWGLLLVFASSLLGLFVKSETDWARVRRGFSLLVFIYGIILMIGAVIGNTNVVCPWQNCRMILNANPHQQLPFVAIKNMEQLDTQLSQAAKDKKIVMLDFYADWCTSCVLMEKYVFTDDDVREKLKDFVLLRADITNNSDFDRELLSRFHVVAPPTILFFDRSGKEVSDQRIVGEVNTKEFLSHIENKKIQE